MCEVTKLQIFFKSSSFGSSIHSSASPTSLALDPADIDAVSTFTPNIPFSSTQQPFSPTPPVVQCQTPPTIFSHPVHQQPSVLWGHPSAHQSAPPPSFRGPWPGPDGEGPLKAQMKYKRVLNWSTLIKKKKWSGKRDCWEMMMRSHSLLSLFHTCCEDYQFRSFANYCFWSKYRHLILYCFIILCYHVFRCLDSKCVTGSWTINLDCKSTKNNLQ